jgi:prolyl oligopeptidase
MRSGRIVALTSSIASLLTFSALTLAGTPPVAPVRPVTEEHCGIQVTDPYRYMEDLKSPEVQTWIKGQADATDSTLARIPIRDELFARIKELDSGRAFRVNTIQRLANGRLFYLKVRAEENLAKLYTRASLTAEEKLLIDPSTLTVAGGGHYSISFYQPSHDGNRVAYGLAASGSEDDVLHVIDVGSGKDLPDQIDRMEDGYTEPQWLADGSGFYYSRRQLLAKGAPETDGYKLTRSYLHRLGTDPGKDPVAFSMELWPNVSMLDVDFPSIVLAEGSRFAIGKIKHGDANPLTLYSAPLGSTSDVSRREGMQSPWKKICDAADLVTDFAVHGSDIYLLTARDAPRFKVVKTSLANPDFAHATTVVPASVRVIDGINSAKDALYVQFRNAGAGEVGRVGYESAKLEPLTLPEKFPSGWVVQASADVPGVTIETSAWTRAGLTYAYDPAKSTFTDTQLNPVGKYDHVAGYESVEVEVKSWDGVMVPLSILYKTGVKLDGSNPTYLTGYGSYGISRNVVYQPTWLAWLERGGVIAVAHVRGGGEFGEEWHLAGQKATKPNTWKDFIASAEYLIAKGYTSPEKLTGQGGSAGGILIGRAITERPDLFAGALLDVGALDAMRMEFTMNGVPNIQEFGTVTIEAECKALYEMSAYHHVKDGTRYPAVMLSHGINDPRVDPWMSAKMCARLQAATTSGKPVLFRVDYQAGHGIGSTKLQTLKSLADKYAFLLWQTGMVKPLP